MSDVKYSISIEAGTAIASIQKLDAAWDGMNKKGKETAAVSGEAATALGNLAAQFTIGALAARGIESVLGGLTRLFVSSIKGAIDEEASQHRLVTALEMTGRARQGRNDAGPVDEARPRRHQGDHEGHHRPGLGHGAG